MGAGLKFLVVALSLWFVGGFIQVWGMLRSGANEPKQDSNKGAV